MNNSLFPQTGLLESEQQLLVLVDKQRDRELLRNALSSKYHITTDLCPGISQNLDLIITDTPTFRRNEHVLHSLKEETSPLFLPILLLVNDSSKLPGVAGLLDFADDILSMPIPRSVLKTRLKLLLQTREYSLQLEKKNRQLKAKNEKLRLFERAIESSSSGIMITKARDNNNPIIYCNRGFEKLTGYNKNEVLGKNPRFLQANDKEQPAFNKIKKNLNEGVDCEVLLRNYRKDGTLFWNELKISPIKNDAGEITHFVGIQTDVTDFIEIQNRLKASQKRWEELVQKDPDLVQITKDGIIQFINPAGARIFGANSPEDIIGKSVFDFIIDEHQEKAKQRKQLVNEGKKAPPTINKIRTLDGEIRFLQVQSMPIRYKGEKAIQTVGQDFTHRVQYEQQLEKSLHEKNTLMQEIHHRVKNNLAIISGLLEMQALDSENSKLQDILNKNKMRVFSIAKVHELLYRHENLSRIKFNEYVKEISRAIGSTFKNQNFTFEFDLPDKPTHLNIHQAVPCGMIINELLTNSIKHSIKINGKGIIRIEMSDKAGRIHLTISDNGIGLPESFDFLDQKGMGITIINLLIKQLEADFHFETGDETQFKFTFKKSAYPGPVGE